MEFAKEETLFNNTESKPLEGLSPSGGSPFQFPTETQLQTESAKRGGTNLPLLEGFATDLNPKDYKDLDEIRPEFGMSMLNQIRAEKQGNLAQFGNAMWRVAEGEILGGMTQSIGALGELPEMASDLYNEIKGDELNANKTDFNNFMMEWGSKLQEHSNQVAPIYRENPGKAMDFGDWAYWMENMPSIFSSISMLIPAWGLEKAASTAVGKSLSALGMLDKVGKTTKDVAKMFTTASFMRHAENVRESYGVYNDARKEVFNKINTDEGYNSFINGEYLNSVEGYELKKRLTGDKEKDKNVIADYISSKAAWTDYKINSLNIGFDLLQVAPLYKGLPINTRSSSWLNLSDEVAAAADVTLTKGQKLVRNVYPYMAGAVGQLSEGLEEAINGIGQKEAEYQYGYSLGLREKQSAGERTSDYFKSKDLYDQALWGWFGGVAFSGLTTGIQKMSSSVDISQEMNKVKLAEIATRKAATESFLKEISSIKKDVADKKITPEVAKERYNLAKSSYASDIAFNASQAGNVDLLIEQITNPEFKKRVLESYSAAELKEIGIDDVDKSIINTVDDILTTERLYKEAYTSLYNKDLEGSLKSNIARGIVKSKFLSERLNKDNNILENKYNDLASKDNYLLNDREDTAENTIQIKSIDYAIDKLNQQLVASQIIHGVGSEPTVRIREKIDFYTKERNKLAQKINNNLASLKGINPELLRLQGEMMWNNVLIRDYNDVAKDFTSDSFIKKTKEAVEKFKKEKEKKEIETFTTDLENDIKSGKLNSQALKALSEKETHEEKKKLLNKKVKELENKEAFERNKEKKETTEEVKTETPTEVVKKEEKQEKENKQDKDKERVESLLKDFDPSTEDKKYLSKDLSPTEINIDKILNKEIVDAARKDELDLEDMLYHIQENNDERVVNIVKASLYRYMNKTETTTEEAKPSTEEVKSELDSIMDELDEGIALFREGAKEAKKLNKTLSTLVPVPLITQKQILGVTKIVKALFKIGLYKFKDLINTLGSRYAQDLSKSLFNAARTAYINEVRERKSRGEDISMFDNLEEIKAAQFESETTNDEIITSSKDSANIYLHNFGLKKDYEETHLGVRAKTHYVTNAYKAVQGLKVGETVVIISNKDDIEKTDENRAMKIMAPVGKGVQIGFLNTIRSLEDLINFANSIKDKTSEELYEMLENSKELNLTPGMLRLLAYKYKESTGATEVWEKPFSEFVDSVLVGNYNSTLKLRQEFAKGKDAKRVLEVTISNKTGGEFVKITPVTPDKIHGSDFEVFMIEPGSTGDFLDVSRPAFTNQVLVSNKDPNRTFTKVNKNLIYRNTDAEYTSGTIYLLLPTFMSTNDISTHTPVPIQIQKVDLETTVPIRNILAKIIKMQREGTTFENEDFRELIKRLGNYVNVRRLDSKNKLGVTVNASKIQSDINNITFEFYGPDNNRYRAILYATGKAFNEFGEAVGTIKGQSLKIQQQTKDKNGNIAYSNVSSDNEFFTDYVDNVDNPTTFKEQLEQILLSLPRSVNWTALKNNEGVEGRKTYQQFLNETGAWKTDVGKVFDHNGEFMGFTTPYGSNKLVLSLDSNSSKSVAPNTTSKITNEEIEERMKKCL